MCNIVCVIKSSNLSLEASMEGHSHNLYYHIMIIIQSYTMVAKAIIKKALYIPDIVEYFTLTHFFISLNPVLFRTHGTKKEKVYSFESIIYSRNPLNQLC